MIGMDIFRDDAFNAVTMTEAIEKMAWQPRYMSSLPGLIVDKPVRTRQIIIEQRSDGARLVQTSPVGTPLPNRNREKPNLRGFETVRVAEQSVIHIAEVSGLRAFGTESELMTVQQEVARRQMLLNADMELTHEYHLLKLVTEGKFIDADGTVLADWFDVWGETPEAVVDFDLDEATPAEGKVYQIAKDVQRTMIRNLETFSGMGEPTVHALCSDEFYDTLVRLPEVRELFKGWTAANALLNDIGRPWQAFRYGDITWHNYRGSANKRVSIPAGECRFYPAGAGIFQRALAPHQNATWVNTMGKALYAQMIQDQSGHEEWVAAELYRYPLYICIAPKALMKGKM